jgi:hypothetical protein
MVIERPRTTSFSLLALYSSLLVSHTVISIDSFSTLLHEGIPAVLGVVAALLAISIILHMPMRDPYLPSDQISPVFNDPNPQHRSPEDNLTLWQFMTVSWMGPLISLGTTRQLNEQDIWQLSYEFQHRNLHDTFRVLPGSVLRRILAANRIDLVIVSFFGFVELVASMSLLMTTASKEAVAELCDRLFDTCISAATSSLYGRSTCTATCCSCVCCPFPSCSAPCKPMRGFRSLVRSPLL